MTTFDPDVFAGPTALYRMFDDAERLLYVGVSTKFPDRFDLHRRKRPWWHDVTLVRIEHYPTRAEALQAELRAIKSESPAYNRASVPGLHLGQGIAKPRPPREDPKVLAAVIDDDDYDESFPFYRG